MSFKDIFKKSFLSQFNSDLSTTSIIMALLITAVIAVYIFAVYRVVCRKAFYSRSFAISLPVIAMITASVIIAVQSSIVISLGMVGALSIVRFRTAVKDPMDLAFLFWSISVGIICGATLYVHGLSNTRRSVNRRARHSAMTPLSNRLTGALLITPVRKSESSLSLVKRNYFPATASAFRWALSQTARGAFAL